MISNTQRALAAIGIASALAGANAQAQGLAQRVANAPDGRVSFNYPAREGACGDGRTYMQVNIGYGSNSYYGNYNNDGNGMAPCVRGPVRVVLEQAAKTVIGLRVYVGPPGSSEGITDLGAVRSRDAADFLMSLVAKAEGSVSQSAIMPAMIADSVNNQAALLAVARDVSRSRETRRSAISWLARVDVPANAAAPLLAIATDENDNQSVRQQALRTLARLEGGAGVPELTRLAGDREGGWVAREALSSLASSGDPRARAYLRTVVRNAELPDEALATAIRSFGQQYATAPDVQLIRDAWPKLTGQKAQEAALSAITEFGGAENAKWLLALARNVGVSLSNQQRALHSAVRAGAKVADLVAIYNSTVDYQMKESIISALSESGEREAVDKLLTIAKTDESITARRRAISALGRSSDPRVKTELQALAESASKR